jgi:hypothetical protein
MILSVRVCYVRQCKHEQAVVVAPRAAKAGLLTVRALRASLSTIPAASLFKRPLPKHADEAVVRFPGASRWAHHRRFGLLVGMKPRHAAACALVGWSCSD